MADFRGIEYTEMVPGSPVEQWEDNNILVTRTFYVAWDDTHLFVSKVLGYPTMVNSGSSDAYVSRLTPMPYAITGSTQDFAYAVSAKVSGMGVPEPQTTEPTRLDPFPIRSMISTPDNVAYYNKAKVVVEYRSLTYEVREDAQVPHEASLDRYVTVKYKPSVEALTMPKGAFRYVDGAAGMVNQGTPFILAKQDVQITWHQVPLIPAAIDTHVGCVNDAEFNASPAETYLLLAAEIEPYRSAVGLRVFDIHYTFKLYAPETGKGHNHIRRFVAVQGNPSANTFDLARISITGTDTGRGIYEKRNFSLLFTPV